MSNIQPSTSFDFKYDPYLQNLKEPDVQKSKSDEENNKVNIFICCICLMEEHYDYKGLNPPFVKYLTMLEECYMMKDPFVTPGINEFVTLGADCSVCKKSVCKALECSFFYLKTFCINCLKHKVNDFPDNVKIKVKRVINL